MTDTPQVLANARKERRARRLRQALVELSDEPQGLEWGELWDRIVETYPLDPDDVELNESGKPRGETSTRFDRQLLDKCGWVLTGVGALRITETGRQVLLEYLDPADLLEAAEAGYAAWEAIRRLQPELPSADTAQKVVPRTPGEVVVLAAAGRILEEGLRSGGSAFVPGLPVWSTETVAALMEAFVENPDLGKRGFLEKLKGQLLGQSDDVVLLAAEMISIVLLPLADWKPATKRRKVKEILAIMDSPVHMDPQISAAMEHGVFSGGVAFKTLIWKALATVIEAASAWWALDNDGRTEAWNDPWHWRELVHSAGTSGINSVRAELDYLLHPSTFLPIVSGTHRSQILQGFAGELWELSGDGDQDLLTITLKLQKDSGGPVDFYRPPFVERWRPKTADSTTGRRAWLVSPAQAGASLVVKWKDESFVSIESKHLGEPDPGSDVPAIRKAVEEGYGHVDYAQRQALVREFVAFLTRVSDDDVVVTLVEDQVHVGVVEGAAVYPDEHPGIISRPVSWVTTVPRTELTASVVSLLSEQGTVVDLTAGLDSLEALMGTDPEPTEEDETEPEILRPVINEVPVLPTISAEVADSLHMPQEELQEIIDLLQSRQQVVLYGPPGTGKTYLAQRLAAHLVGRDNPSRAQLVQFHPSYAYEDFVEGFRPDVSDTGQATFRLVAGPLRDIASAANSEVNRGAPFVLIIDEMNRANLAKVFGELYFLLEYRDEAIRLQYSPDKAFQLPKNLFVIATMNTADRSIAMVDAAIRRRFAFVELHPDTEPVRSLLPSFLNSQGRNHEPVRLLGALNEAMDDIDRDFRIGPSYLMRGEAATSEGLERIWKYDLLPLLEEHYYGRLSRAAVHERFGLDALRSALLDAADEI